MSPRSFMQGRRGGRIISSEFGHQTRSRPAHLFVYLFGKSTPFIFHPLSPPLLSSPPSLPLNIVVGVVSSARRSFHASIVSAPWLLQPTPLRTQRTRMPSPRSSSPIMPARSSVRVPTSSASQSSRSASQGVYSSAIGQSPGQSALPSNLARVYTDMILTGLRSCSVCALISDLVRLKPISVPVSTVFLDSWLFLFASGIVVSGIGMSLNTATCQAGIYLCIVL